MSSKLSSSLELKGNLSYLKPLKIVGLLVHIYSVLLSSLGGLIAISAGTGSGKTVGTPRFLLDQILNGSDADMRNRRILVAIPTVINVRAQYIIACENNPDIAHEFAQICGGTKTSNHASARLTYATTQSVVNMILKLYKKKRFAELNNLIVIVDEAHHPSQENYMLHAILNYLRRKGFTMKMKIVIMTATPADHPFEQLRVENPIVLETTANPIVVHWPEYSSIIYDRESRETRVIEKLNVTVVQKVSEAVQILKPLDNILVFVSGESEVISLCEKLSSLYPTCDVLPLFSSLPQEEIDKVSRITGKRKIIIATNVAENGITIPGVMAVIDTMLYNKVNHISSGSSTVTISAIPQSSSMQRRGRAARTPTECIGHYFPSISKSDFDNLPKDNDNEFLSLPKHIPILTLFRNGLPAQEVLMMQHDEYITIVDELTSMKLIIADKNDSTEYLVTPLGEDIVKYPVSINNSIAMLRAIEVYKVSKDDYVKRTRNFVQLLQFLIGIAMIESKMTVSKVFDLPKDKLHKATVKDQLTDLFGEDTDILVLVSVFCQMMIANFNERTGKIDYRSWCRRNNVNVKFIDIANRLFNQLWYLVFSFARKSVEDMYIGDFHAVLELSSTSASDTMYTILADTCGQNHMYTLSMTCRGPVYINSKREIFSLDNNTCSNMSKILPSRICALGQTTFATTGKQLVRILSLCFPYSNKGHADTLPVPIAPISAHDTHPILIGLEHIGAVRQAVFFNWNTGTISDKYTFEAVQAMKNIVGATHPSPPIELAHSFVWSCLHTITNANQFFHVKNLIIFLHKQNIIHASIIAQTLHSDGARMLNHARLTNPLAVKVYETLCNTR